VSGTSSTDRGRCWAALRVGLPDEVAEVLPGRLGTEILGAEVVPLAGDRVELVLYVADDERAAALEPRVLAVLAEFGLDATVRREVVADGRWVEAYQAGLHPLSLGERFVVLPGDDHAGPPGREPIVLVPGRAFGTGEHSTTRLCAAALERHVAAGSRWLDLGTGSGILAVVAARCGAGAVDAVDVDADAVEVAREVVARNAVADRVVTSEGSASDRPADRYDGVVANISESYFFAESASIARALRPGGLLIASGFLRDDADAVDAALSTAGFSLDGERTVEGPWVCRLAWWPGRCA
jgi:ribosomal protein L11 methyltransferase